MKKHYTLSASIIGILFASILLTVHPLNAKETEGAALTEVAKSSRQWTGVTVSKSGRVFVCYPRWSDDVTVSCAEVLTDGSTKPFPDDKWNHFDKANPGKCFVCIQSVVADDQNNLWILDPGAPKFQGPISGAPKLLKVNLQNNSVDVVYHFDSVACPPNSYLNDVRIDLKKKTAYMTDSGLGAIVVLDLESSQARRVLANHPSTKPEDIKVVIGGKEWKQPNGSVRRIGSDGIALDQKGEYLYYKALTGKTLYRIPTAELLKVKNTEEALGKAVQKVAVTCPSDGIEFGDNDDLYITAIEENAIKRLSLRTKKMDTVARDKMLIWPDTLARSNNGWMYVTASQINLMPKPPSPYKLFKFRTSAK